MAFFPSLKHNFIAYRSSKVSSRPDCIFEIHQLWQSGFSRVYSNCCCSCSFEAEIIKIGQSSHKMYSNNIVNFQESTILNACTKKSGNLLKAPYICKCIYPTRHAGHCWRSRDELISDVLLWTPTYGRAKAGWPARTYIQQLCEDMGCSPEDLPEAMNDREKWRERVRDIRANGTTWWWFTQTLYNRQDVAQV